MTIPKAKLAAFVKARHPHLRRDNRAGGWGDPSGSGRFLSDRDAMREAETEIEAARDGIAMMPKWAAN